MEPNQIEKLADEEQPTEKIDTLLKSAAWKNLLPEGSVNRRTPPARFKRLVTMMKSRAKMEVEQRLKNDHLMRSHKFLESRPSKDKILALTPRPGHLKFLVRLRREGKQ